MASKDGGLVAHSVREALGTLVSPQVYAQLVARALASDHLSEIPEQGHAVAQWIQGALLREVEHSVGPDAADLVAKQLAPVVLHAVTHAAAGPPPAASRGSDRVTSRDPISDRASVRSAPYVRVASDRVGARVGSDRAKQRGPSDRAEPRSASDRATKPSPSDRANQRPPSDRANQRPPSDRAARRAPSDRANQRSGDITSRPARGPFSSEIPTGLVSAPPPRQSAATARTQLTPQQVAAMNQAGHTTRPAAPDPQDHELRRVLIASNTRPAVDALHGYLHGVAKVIKVADLVGLLDVLDDKSLHDPIVLIDCQRPTVHVTSVAAIGEDLPSGTTILLWGVSEDTWRQLDRDRVPSCRWVRCSHEATPGDIGSLISMLLSQH